MCTVTILVHDGIGRASFNVGVSGVFRAGMVGGISLCVAGMPYHCGQPCSLHFPLGHSVGAFSGVVGCDVGGGGSGIGCGRWVGVGVAVGLISVVVVVVVVVVDCVAASCSMRARSVVLLDRIPHLKNISPTSMCTYRYYGTRGDVEGPLVGYLGSNLRHPRAHSFAFAVH
jgi:hypothetical protein